jgi:PAS domain S-box-containing protein
MHESSAQPDSQLAHFFSLSLDLFAVADNRGYFNRLNPAWESALGYTLEELMSKPYWQFVHPEDLDATITAKEGLANGQRILNFENRYQAKNGGWRWLSWVAAPQEDGTVFAVARDITDQKEERQQILDLLQKVEKTNQQLDQFAFVVSHDLKSPMRAIMGLSEWISEDIGHDAPEVVKRHLDKLRRRVETMYTMIHDLLQYSRIGRTQTSPSPVDLQMVWENLQNQVDAPEGFEFRVANTLPVIMGRELEIRHLLLNLLDNAVKYRKGTDDFVEISCQPSLEGWIFQVKDGGIGIHPDHHERIFQLFQRLGNPEQIQGTGVGLSLSKRIVELAGGNIWVESQEGQGATFFFTWPEEQNPHEEPIRPKY